MPLHRTALIHNLENVEPALSDNAMVPVLSHFWFTGKQLLAYNGTIAIAVPCETEFKGAVPRTMLKMLRTYGGSDIEVNSAKGTLEVKVGPGKFKLITLPPEDFEETFTMKAMPKDADEVDADEFIDALRCCLRSVSSDTSRADYQGITVIPRGKGVLWFFSFDRVTISHAIVKGNIYSKDRVILSTEWCKQALALLDANKSATFDLEINEDWSLLRVNVNKDEDVKLFGNNIQPDSPLPFEDVLASSAPKDLEFVKLEDQRVKLTAMLDRARIIASGGVAKVRTKFEVDRGKLFFDTESEIGSATDSVNAFDKHPDVKGSIDPGAVLEGIKHFDMVAMTETTFVMKTTDGRRMYLVSGTEGTDEG